MEEQTKKKKKKKPRVIHALGNMKWGFAPPRQGAINVDALQTKWDRDHSLKAKVGVILAYLLIECNNFRRRILLDLANHLRSSGF